MKKAAFPIDLSMLTELEIKQFRDDPSTLFEGDTDVALYLRFSSEKQKEQSIEGQLRDCISYCKAFHYRISAIYVDRSKSAKTAKNRVHFQRMIEESTRHEWKYVVVWKLDRFARNRNDSAVYKARLKKNGVRVISATEAISEQPEGIILEAVLEGMAEFYSAELSQKVSRGMRESAIKGMSVGGTLPLGYKIENKRYVIDPITAPIAQEAFERYANGETVAEICNRFNDLGYKTVRGGPFNKNSFHRMFRNERYIGVYTHGDVRHETGMMPALIDRSIWDAVQDRLGNMVHAPGKGKAKESYMLTGKLFCGHCGEMMVGESGRGKNGKNYYYYSCIGRKKLRECDKKPVKKDWIERIVAEDAMALMTDDIIEELADVAVKQAKADMEANTIIPALKQELKETEDSIDNIVSMIEKGVASDRLAKRLTQLEKDQKSLEKRIALEMKDVVILEKPIVIHWLKQFTHGDIENPTFQRQIINLLINTVTVWDDPDGYFTITTTYNLMRNNKKSVKVKIPSNATAATGSAFSDLVTTGSPLEANPNPIIVMGMVFAQTRKHRQP